MKRDVIVALIAALLAFVAYPPLTRPIGVFTNGGLVGLTILIVATLLAWVSCSLNRDRTLTRWLFETPVTIGASYLLLNEITVHFVTAGYYLMK